MTARSAFVDEAVQRYIVETTVREGPAAAELRAHTQQMEGREMQIGPDQAAFMQLLARAISAKKYLEIGVFTGYSALAVALALPPEGTVTACDVNAEYVSIAREYWKKAGVEQKIHVKLGPALETLRELLASGGAESFDMAFIDADKHNVDGYYEACLQLIRPGGLILVDNALWNGAVARPETTDPDTVALRDLNAKASADARVHAVLLPVGDGLLIAWKR